MKRRSFLALAIVALPLALPVHAQTPAPFQAELIDDWSTTRDHLIQLADAIPADKYSWRPREGVRSVSEVFVHIAGGNYLMLAMMGVKPPAEYFPNLPEKPSAQDLIPHMRNLQKNVTRKEDVIRMLKDSLVQFGDRFPRLTQEDLDRQVDFFGNKTTVRGMSLRLFAHDNEHYGQMIAYARVIGVVPPWSK